MPNIVNNHTDIQDKSNTKLYNLKVEKLIREASDNFIYYRDYETALDQLNEALSIQPNHTKALILKGDLLICIDRDNEALECFNIAIDSNPHSAEAYGSKAGILNMIGRQKEALQCCEKAFEYITLKERYLLTSLYDQKIAILLGMKKIEEARETLKKAARNLPDDASGFIISSYQNLIESSYKEKKRKREMVAKISLKLVYS